MQISLKSKGPTERMHIKGDETILKAKGITTKEPSARYILKSWTKDAKSGVLLCKRAGQSLTL